MAKEGLTKPAMRPASFVACRCESLKYAAGHTQSGESALAPWLQVMWLLGGLQRAGGHLTWHGDHSLGDRAAQVRLCVRFQLLQDEGTYLAGRVLLAAGLQVTSLAFSNQQAAVHRIATGQKVQPTSTQASPLSALTTLYETICKDTLVRRQPSRGKFIQASP